MSGATATASGDRSVAVAGDIHNSVVITGDRNLLIVPEAIAGTLLKRAAREPTITARERPVAVLPPAYGDRIGRDAEIAALRRHSSRALSVVGEGLIGKTYLLSAAFDAATSVTAPDGIVFLYGRQRPLRDLLHEVWEAFHESDPPTVPSDLQIRRDLADRDAVVVVDSAELAHADAQSLAAAVPRSRVVVATRERRWWDGDAVSVAGLAEGDALALLARELGDGIAPGDEVAARIICQALGGRPVSIKQVAGLVRRGQALTAIAEYLRETGGTVAGGGDADTVVAREAITRASASEQELLAALMPFGGAPVGIPMLDALLGRPTAGQATALAAAGLLRRGSPRFALALPAEVTEKLDSEIAERAAQNAVRWASHASADALHLELDPLLALWHRMPKRVPYPTVAELGRALVPALVRARRFATWGGVAEHLDRRAGAAGDTATQAWARHELGTQAVATGDTPRGVALLREALRMRRDLSDRAGVRATRRNLRVVAPPPGPPPWIRTVVLTLAATAAAVGLIANMLIDEAAEPVTIDTTENENGGPSEEQDPGSTEDEDTGTEEVETDDAGDDNDTDDTDDDTASPEDPQGPQLWRVTVIPGGGGGTVVMVPEDDREAVPDDQDDPLIQCPTRCTAELAVGQSITLRADPDEGWAFTGWGAEACSAADTCRLAGGTDVVVTPLFEPEVTLTVILKGTTRPNDTVAVRVDEGSLGPSLGVESDQPCLDRCQYNLPPGTIVTLTPTVSYPWRHGGWAVGECSGAGDHCVVTLRNDLEVVAIFDPPVRLSVAVTGRGSVVSSPAGMACQQEDAKPGSKTQCAAYFPAGSDVKLTAFEAEGWELIKWGGDCPTQSPLSRTCELSLRSPQSAEAVFDIRGPH